MGLGSRVNRLGLGSRLAKCSHISLENVHEQNELTYGYDCRPGDGCEPGRQEKKLYVFGQFFVLTSELKTVKSKDVS